jgi:phage terminase large subunit-like protein
MTVQRFASAAAQGGGAPRRSRAGVPLARAEAAGTIPLAGQQALFDEMTSFPFGEHDDLLDAAATGTAYLLDRPEPRVWCEFSGIFGP